MKKSIYTGIFCTILGLYTNTPANASIVTRGFLDQALTDYATNTALDLKANQSDLTDLSSKIGRLPSGSLIGNSPAMDDLFKYTQKTDTPVYPGSLSDLINQIYGVTDGAPSAISAILTGFKYSGFDDQYDGLVGILPAMELGLNATAAAKAASTTATEAKTAADANTAKIGTLPEGITVQGMYEGWTDPKGIFYPGLYNLSKTEKILQNTYNTISSDLLIQGAESTTIDGVDYTGPVYPLWRLSEGIDRIGTLPRGLLPEGNTAMHDLFKTTQDTNTPVYPVSLSDLINQFYGNTEEPGAIAYLLKGFKHNEFKFSDEYDGNVGVLPAMELGLTAKTAAETAQATADRAKALAESNSTAIGTLPSGSLLNVSKGITDELYINAQGTNTPVYPTSLAEFIQQIYGTPGSPFGVLPVLVNNLNNLKTTIGTLPDGYKTVGEALTTIDGKIGTLPTTLSALPPFIEIFGMDKDIDLPTDIGGILSLLFSTDGGKPTFYGLANAIMRGYESSDGISVPGLRGINDKIGTLPEGITVQGMFEGWTDSKGIFVPGLNILSNEAIRLGNAYNSETPSHLLIHGAEATKIDGVDYTGPVYPLWKLSEGIDKIGTLPGGYENVGDALATIDGKIGELHIGNLPDANAAIYELFKSTQGTDTPRFPKSLSDLIYQLYGGTEGEPGAISALLKGFEYSVPGFSVEYDGLVGVLPAMELGLTAKTAAETAQATANRAKALAESNSTAIGALPDGYETVGEALNAIKGIAEEAKATALAAIPDPKTEGSNGKYVLTVDIIGDNATYRWEPIDRGNTTTTTTTTE